MFPCSQGMAKPLSIYYFGDDLSSGRMRFSMFQIDWTLLKVRLSVLDLQRVELDPIPLFSCFHPSASPMPPGQVEWQGQVQRQVRQVQRQVQWQVQRQVHTVRALTVSTTP